MHRSNYDPVCRPYRHRVVHQKACARLSSGQCRRPFAGTPLFRFPTHGNKAGMLKTSFCSRRHSPTQCPKFPVTAQVACFSQKECQRMDVFDLSRSSIQHFSRCAPKALQSEPWTTVKRRRLFSESAAKRCWVSPMSRRPQGVPGNMGKGCWCSTIS